MAMPEHHDVLILGSGAGGKLLAWHAAKSGQRTAVVERRWIGGSCPNIACMPSKNEIWSAKLAHAARQAAQLGAATGDFSLDMAAVLRRKREMVEDQVASHVKNYQASGAALIMGTGRFVAPKTIEARSSDGTTRLLTGDRVFLNVGTHAAIPEIPALAAARPLTHIEALELDYAPAHLVVLGAGYVGLEMAQAYRRFGSRVTVIEHGPRLLGREDSDVSDEILRILSDERIAFMSGTTVLGVRRSGSKISVTVRTGSGEWTVEASDILVAAGRVPNTEGIGLELADVELDDRGYVRVNDRLETTAPGVWAIGECAGSPQFTHASVDDCQIIWANLAGGTRTTRDRLVPYCMFTDPPLAHVGLNQTEAERQGIRVRVARLPMSAVLRSQTTGEKQGFMKVLVGADHDRILGFTMIGAEAGEVMTTVQTAMLADLPYARLRDTVIAHLTMTEGLSFLLAAVPPRSEQQSAPRTAA